MHGAQNIRINGSESDTFLHQVYSFYQYKKFFSLHEDMRLDIKVDSAGLCILDTFVVLRSKNVHPFISFLELSDSGGGSHKFFIGSADEWPNMTY